MNLYDRHCRQDYSLVLRHSCCNEFPLYIHCHILALFLQCFVLRHFLLYSVDLLGYQLFFSQSARSKLLALQLSIHSLSKTCLKHLICSRIQCKKPSQQPLAVLWRCSRRWICGRRRSGLARTWLRRDCLTWICRTLR